MITILFPVLFSSSRSSGSLIPLMPSVVGLFLGVLWNTIPAIRSPIRLFRCEHGSVWLFNRRGPGLAPRYRAYPDTSGEDGV